MLRPLMTLLCLIAALTGTPLRQAEAAGDLARSLDEVAGDHVIETVDGGVGDESGETVLKAGAESETTSLAPSMATVGRTSTPLMPAPSPAGFDAHRRVERTASPQASSLLRHAWLHRFLF